jgi:L-lactate dehydrogenase complex protein LldF
VSFEQTPFPAAAAGALADHQLRANLRRATRTIRDRRAEAVGEMPDWEELRSAGERIKRTAIRHLDRHLEELERSIERAGGTVHWASSGEQAIEVVAAVARSHGTDEVIKVKSLATDEIGLNEGLARRGIGAIETDLAELIVQLAGDLPSHILVPAIHRNRAEIRDILSAGLGVEGLGDRPAELAEAARRHLRSKFLSVPVGVSGANFAVAETGTICVVESEGNGRMCTTLPRALVTVVGIEKVLPRFRDLEVMLQLLPRSSTGERMNPYTSLWTGVTPGDGPEELHVVLLDAGRTDVLADPIGRDALHCIRCSACLNVCPVYERVGGHAYRSVYPGPIGAILTPQLERMEEGRTLPWASSLCGACYEVCPVKIDIPSLLVHLRGRVVREREGSARVDPERMAMRALARTFSSRRRYEAAQRAGRIAQWPFVRGEKIERLPGPLAAWTEGRDMRPLPPRTFRNWWRSR